ncbi:MAG: PIN domain-containing protein [Candidatus Goldbacteria bacterium]|nr:PIN domain-containing protein [Candidatus Goldiibacteriota bacterium]
MEPIFIDTSALYACFDKSDRNYSVSTVQIHEIEVPLFTTNYVIDETMTLLAKNLGVRLAYEIGTNLLNERFAKIVRVSSDDEKHALEILCKYSDKKFSFTDCISFAIMEKLKIKTAFSFDKHFRQYGKFNIIP